MGEILLGTKIAQVLLANVPAKPINVSVVKTRLRLIETDEPCKQGETELLWDVSCILNLTHPEFCDE